LPPDLGDWKNTQRRFCRWRDRGVWEEDLDDQHRPAAEEGGADEAEALLAEAERKLTLLKNHAEEMDKLRKERDQLAAANSELRSEIKSLKTTPASAKTTSPPKTSALTLSLQAQLQKLQDLCRALDAENRKLKLAGLSAADADLARQQAGRYESLLRENMALKERNGKLKREKACLEEESLQCRERCQHLEDLLAEEERDIDEVLTLIRSVGQTANNAAASIDPGPLNPADEAARRPIKLP